MWPTMPHGRRQVAGDGRSVWGVQVVKYIDMPLQHWSNLTLLSMNRPPQAHTRALLNKLRGRIPGLALRTTFISGFPGNAPASCYYRGCPARY